MEPAEERNARRCAALPVPTRGSAPAQNAQICRLGATARPRTIASPAPVGAGAGAAAATLAGTSALGSSCPFIQGRGPEPAHRVGNDASDLARAPTLQISSGCPSLRGKRTETSASATSDTFSDPPGGANVTSRSGGSGTSPTDLEISMLLAGSRAQYASGCPPSSELDEQSVDDWWNRGGSHVGRVGTALTTVRSACDDGRSSKCETPSMFDEGVLLQKAVEASPSGMIAVDPLSGRILMANQTTCLMFGYKREELMGSFLEMLIPERFRDAHIRYRKTFAERSEVRLMGQGRDLYGLRNDGTEFNVEIGLSPIDMEGGSLIVIASIVDITSRRERETVEAKLRDERDALIRMAVEASPSAMVIVKAGEEGTIVMVNATAERMFGYDRVELIGQPVEILVPEDVRSAHRGWRAGYHERPSIRQMGHNRDLYAQRKDCSEFSVEIGLSPFSTPESGPMVIASIVDITERKRLETMQREKNRADLELARAKDAIKSREDFFFLAMSSHELRTPLTGILGLTTLLADTPLNEEQKQMVATIEDCNNVVVSLINDIIDLSRLAADKLLLEVIPFDLTELLNETRRIMEVHVSPKSLYLTSSVDPDVPPLLAGDPSRVRQVLLNLLSNSVKFTDSGGIHVTVSLQSTADFLAQSRDGRISPSALSNDDNALSIKVPGGSPSNSSCKDYSETKTTRINASTAPLASVSPRSESGLDVTLGTAVWIRFVVEDTGCGMTDELLKRLFQPFSQADTSTTRQHGGSGLGLAISRNLCDIMGGSIWPMSTLGQGSKFTFVLPFFHLSAETLPSACLDKQRVRLVEPDEHLSNALSAQLQHWGASVQCTATLPVGDAPTEEVAPGPGAWDLLIVDCNVDAQATDIKLLRSLAGHAPVILLTSSAPESLRVVASDSEAIAPSDHPVRRFLLSLLGHESHESTISGPALPSSSALNSNALQYVVASYTARALSSAIQQVMPTWQASSSSGFSGSPSSNQQLLQSQLSSRVLSSSDRRAHSPVPVSSISPAIPVLPLTGKRVLLVEDNAVNQRLVKTILAKSGCEVDLADNGLEAVHKWEANPTRYHAILLDVEMPVMDGFLATKEIRQHETARRSAGKAKAGDAYDPSGEHPLIPSPTTPQVPIISMTAHAMVGDRERCLQAGMNDYISKPLRAAALVDLLVRWTA